ncbi:alpha/beta hydrolase [[Eubacterium] cellulosolvens]
MAEKVTIAIGHEQIAGVFHQADSDSGACIISCHGLLANKDSPKYIFLAEELRERGLSSVRFDFRGCGESDGKLENSHVTNRAQDLKMVMDYVTDELGFEKLGLFGSSMGGFISFLLASSSSNVKALVTLAAPYSMAEIIDLHFSNAEIYELNHVVLGSNFIEDLRSTGNLTPKLIGKIQCPTYIFHGDLDGIVPTNHAKRLYNDLKTEKKLEIIPGGDHVFSLPWHLNRIIQTSADWFQKHLQG